MCNIPGQGWVLHCCSWLLKPEQIPPWSSTTSLVLVLVWVPPPQVTGHAEYFPQLDHVQFTEKIGTFLYNYGFLRRPQNLTNSPSLFDIYFVKFLSTTGFNWIFLAILENLNLNHSTYSESDLEWHWYFFFQNFSDLLWEKIVKVIEKNFWNTMLMANF